MVIIIYASRIIVLKKLNFRIGFGNVGCAVSAAIIKNINFIGKSFVMAQKIRQNIFLIPHNAKYMDLHTLKLLRSS